MNDGIDFDYEGLKQSIENNGWHKDVKEIVIEKVNEIIEFIEDLKRVKVGEMDVDEFIEKYGRKGEIALRGDEQW